MDRIRRILNESLDETATEEVQTPTQAELFAKDIENRLRDLFDLKGVSFDDAGIDEIEEALNEVQRQFGEDLPGTYSDQTEALVSGLRKLLKAKGLGREIERTLDQNAPL